MSPYSEDSQTPVLTGFATGGPAGVLEPYVGEGA